MTVEVPTATELAELNAGLELLDLRVALVEQGGGTNPLEPRLDVVEARVLGIEAAVPDLVYMTDGLEIHTAALTNLGGRLDNLTGRVTSLESRTFPGLVLLDSFVGSDDEKMEAAMRYCAQQTLKPMIVPPQRRVKFLRSKTYYNGFKFGAISGHGDFKRSANSTPNDIRIDVTGPFLIPPASSGSIFDLYIGGLGFEGSSGCQFIATAGMVIWTSAFRDLGFSGFKHLFGRPGQKFLNTACLWDGWWNVNNFSDVPFTFGGSDSAFKFGRCLTDTPRAYSDSWVNKFMWNFESQQKTIVENLYVTCQNKAGGVLVKGSAGNGALNFVNCTIEGMNPGNPANVPQFRIEGDAAASIEGGSMYYGNYAPIEVAGGQLYVSKVWHKPPSEPAVPFLRQTGGQVEISDMRLPVGTSRPTFVSTGGEILSDFTIERFA